MKNTYAKSAFHKLYLIDKEMYDRILPQLNNVEKQELDNLNDEHRPDFENNEDNTADDTHETDKQDVNGEIVEQNTTEKPLDNAVDIKDIGKIPIGTESETEDVEAEKLNQTADTFDRKQMLTSSVGKKASTRQMKPKKFECDSCNKSFTTKYSLNRHHRNFHEHVPTMRDDRELILPEVSYAERRGQKRSNDDIEYEEATHFKRPRIEEFVRNQPHGIKRKAPKRATDNEPRKRLHWESF